MDSLLWGDVSRKELTENITLLWLLNEEPEQPAENPLPQHLLKEAGSASRQLTIERERDLVDSLAFLSASSDDPRKVMAVCMEENQDTESLTIRMATNAGDLEPVKEGFLRMATILERAAAKDNTDENSSALFEEMIALNRGRIYSRLRSRHAKRSRRNHNKPPIVVQLAKAASALSPLTTTRLVPRVDLKTLHSQVEELQRLFRQLEAMTEKQATSQKSHKILISLLKCAHSLASQNDLRKLFVKASLPLAIGKLGRYYSTCSFLIVAARRLSIFRSVRVESVRLPLPASPPISIAQSKSTLPGTLDRILEPQTERWTQRWASSIAPAEAKFCRQMAASPKTYKIHAEIQLLFYYEMHPEIMRPRVICSSKSACFLCDLFVKIHAKFYVARTHGVLYDRWILPDQGTIHLFGKGVKDMTRVVERFKATLEDRIRLTLPLLRMPRFHPNESVLVEPAIWTPSAVSLASNTASQVISAMLNSEACLKNQPDTMGDIEAFRSGPTTSTNADLAAVGRCWSSTDRTLSGPKLGNGGCSDLLTSASSIDMPARDPEGSLEPRGRQDGIINSDIRQASPTSPYLFDRPTYVSSKSPRSIPRDGSVSKLPVGDKAQWDFTDHNNPRSSASVQSLDLSRPIMYPDAVAPKYEPLTQGTWIERELPTGGPPVKLSTKLIHITLSRDWAGMTHKSATTEGQQNLQESLGSEGVYLVKVKWLGPEEEPKRSSEQRTNIVDLDEMDETLEETLSHGAASSSTELYIYRRNDMIAIKFILKE
ncbi:hypothetical protein HO133_008545 [Letharia lupina]|uniref:Uncharacterized protein n=1 Tax=Letharia lupina TaxID=560253 RepID=A0A8H6FGL5_9LECA|nr:uncharacterized protein HO133_008545 [Letharia lupina]KAF6227104.1 hypothetical protein HO133_008545 [Letharia lupina]